MHKKYVRYMLFILFFFFFFIYNFGSFIFRNNITLKKELTEKQIKEFEKDIDEGREIDLKKYVVKEEKYNNSVTDINSNISHFIEKTFRKIFKHFIKNL